MLVKPNAIAGKRKPRLALGQEGYVVWLAIAKIRPPVLRLEVI